MSPGSVYSVGRFSSSQRSFSDGCPSVRSTAPLASAGSPLLQTIETIANMSLRESLRDRSSDISAVTASSPIAIDSRLRTAARMSPADFSAMASIARGSTSTPSCSAILYSALAIVDALALLNVI